LETLRSLVIHPTAVVDPGAELADGVVVGPYTIIERDVQIGAGTEIASHVLIAAGTRLGRQCRVAHGAVLGTIPQDLKFSGERTTLEIGDETTIREFATLNRGTANRWVTQVGKGCLIMAYVHIAHDCRIGDHVVLANAVNMAGHVVVEDYASVGGLVPIHQFVRIGRHAFVGGGYRVAKDVPPYVLASGEPLAFAGLNTVGLNRRGFSRQTMLTLKRVYRLVFRSGLNVTQALERIEAEFDPIPEVQHVIDFIRASERGIIR
jgi:UDP-N-acetylglucosamine acyltransferase